MSVKRFQLTDEHIALLTGNGRVWIEWDHAMNGAPCMDAKRPYGNSDLPRDIADILGWEYDPEEGVSNEQFARALRLHNQTQMALEVILNARTFEPGTYQTGPWGVDWKRIDE